MTKTEKVLYIALTFAALIIVGLLFAWAMKGEPKTATSDVPAGYYTLSAHVCDADTRTNVIVFEDGAGNLWEAEGTREWNIGDNVELLMHNNGTENVTDDEIIGIARGRWYMEHN